MALLAWFMMLVLIQVPASAGAGHGSSAAADGDEEAGDAADANAWTFMLDSCMKLDSHVCVCIDVCGNVAGGVADDDSERCVLRLKLDTWSLMADA